MSERPKLLLRLGDPSLLLAIPATICYYVVMFLPTMRESVLYMYTTQHAVEYVIVGIFMWGMIDMLLKVLMFPKELWALHRDWIPSKTGRIPASQASSLLEQVRSQPTRMVQSRIGQRLIHALGFVVENQSAEEFPEHLRYLADQDDEATYFRYSLIRFVVAVTPILGFLGTVVHFGTALGGLSLNNLDGGLDHVVREMGTAFRTTTVALAAAMIAMFTMFLCERMEHGIIARINRMLERELLNRFEVKNANLVPFLSTLNDANLEFQAAVQRSLADQIATWSVALQGLFEQFDKRQQAEEQRWLALCEEQRETHKKFDDVFSDRLKQLLTVADARQEQHLAQIRIVLERAAGFSGDVSELARTLQSVARGEGRLADLQTTLTENLRLLHETNQIDAALHGLTAAIHLLTVRNQAGPFNNAA